MMNSRLIILLYSFVLIKFEFVHSCNSKYSGNAFIRDLRVRLVSVSNTKKTNDGDYVVFDTVGLVEQHDYPIEEHNLITEDGYKLRIFRIPSSPKSQFCHEKPVVFLQHGILWSSDAFVLRGPQHDISFMLADAGYDVWMGNVRGNSYGKGHQTKSPHTFEFWDFSYHEMGTKDLPAMIDYVLQNTSQKALYYVGHSMGATIAYVMLSLRPEYNAKIRLLISLAPVTLWRHPLNLIQSFFGQVSIPLQETFKRNEIYEILPQTTGFAQQIKNWCREDVLSYTTCLNTIFGVVGEDREQLNAEVCKELPLCYLKLDNRHEDFQEIHQTLLPYLFLYFPAGTSLRTIDHFHQNMLSGEFQNYDFHPEENLKRYGQIKPLYYPLWKITAPVALIYGKNDAIVTYEEMCELMKYLGNVTILEAVPLDKFNHMDFIWALDVKELLYKRILQLILQY